MAKIPYTKPALTLDQQVQQLRQRGMSFGSEAKARHYLGALNYYRLTAYWIPFEANHNTHAFAPGTTFEAVLDRYVFDRELRLLTMDAIERVEVAVRTQFAYHLGHTYGPHALSVPGRFNPPRPGWNYATGLNQLTSSVRDSREVFIQHLRDKYLEPLPPIWAVVELMSLGELSKWLGNLSSSADRNAISRHFGLDESILTSFLHHLAIVRNVCAHHSRLWNRSFVFTARQPRRDPKIVVDGLSAGSQKKLYNTLVMLAYLMDKLCPDHEWKKRLRDLILHHRIPIDQMGFPSDWQARAIWK